MSKLRPFIGPVQLKTVNFGVDTLLVNFKFADTSTDKPNGGTLPESVAALLDAWQKDARKIHKPVATPLEYRGKSLLIRPHGSGVWSWLLFNEDVTLSLSYGSMNGGVFCQARFLSHLLWRIGPETALVDLMSTLYDFCECQLSGNTIYPQASEIHVCADLQGWYDGPLNWEQAFVSRVTTMRARPDEPTEHEQEGGLSPKAIRKLETFIQQTRLQQQEDDEDDADTLLSPIVTTAHRRLATLDFGSHGSEIMGQIYNKTVEIKKSKKTYFEPIWLANGWDGLSTIWRIEFRFRRKALASFELNEAFSVLAQVQLLWDYATQHWLRYIDLTSTHDTNKSRLPTDHIWQVIQSAYPQEEQLSPADPVIEQELRLAHLLEERPLQLLEQATIFAAPHDEALHEPMASFLGMRESFQDEPLPLVREVATDLLATLSPDDLAALVAHLSPEPFHEVRSSLIKRARRMARKRTCVSSFAGYLTSIMALSPDEVADQPDLQASLIVAFGEVQRYNKEKGRSHLEEVWKKRLLYGFVTARQIEEECRLHGLDLSDDDWSTVEYHLTELTRRSSKHSRSAGTAAA